MVKISPRSNLLPVTVNPLHEAVKAASGQTSETIYLHLVLTYAGRKDWKVVIARVPSTTTEAAAAAAAAATKLFQYSEWHIYSQEIA